MRREHNIEVQEEELDAFVATHSARLVPDVGLTFEEFVNLVVPMFQARTHSLSRPWPACSAST